MGIVKVGGAFRTSVDIGAAENVQDSTSNASGNPSWSTGATLIDQLQAQVPAGAVWTLLGYSITTFMRLDQLSAGSYGKFGKVWGGIAPNLPPTPVKDLPPGYLNFIDRRCAPHIPPPLPQDASLLLELWDPDIDPLPPVSAALSGFGPQQSNLLPITKGLQLPQPLEVRLGDQLGIGLWISPSLMGNTTGQTVTHALSLESSTYTLTYDDGKPPPPAT